MLSKFLGESYVPYKLSTTVLTDSVKKVGPKNPKAVQTKPQINCKTAINYPS